jgi:hypothetical protein
LVGAHQRQSFDGGLSDKQPVEGIFVVVRQRVSSQGTVEADRQNLEAIDQELARDEVLDLQVEPEPAKASIDRNLPTTDNTEIDFVEASPIIRRAPNEMCGSALIH